MVTPTAPVPVRRLVSGPVRRPTPSAMRGRRQWVGVLFCLPLLVLVLAFVAWPIISLVRYSFTKYNGLTDPKWVGLENYRFLVSWPDFHRILFNNAVLAAAVSVWVCLPFLLSIVIFRMRRADLLRTILFVPAMLSPIVVGGVFRIVLADNGPVNGTLRSLHLGWIAPQWLSSDRFVLVTVIVVIAWATMGSGVLFYSAALANISPSYLEAAELDGATVRQMIWHIYRPALRPVTRFWMLLLTVTTVTGFFPWIYGLTNGGPGVSSTTLDYAVYQTLNQGDQLGRGAAIAVVAVLLVGVVIALQLVSRRLRGEESWS